MKKQGPTVTIHSRVRCEQNPACCSKRNALCFAQKFKPPLLGTQKEFCHQATGRGIPVKNCDLGKPVTFIYPRSIFYGLEPADKPGSAPQLKNWKKWCTIWHSNQEALRHQNIPPSLMTCGEGWRRKQEDIELVERTIHSHHMVGFNIKFPIEKECEGSNIHQTLSRRLFRDYPSMEKIRVPKVIRKEIHLPQRHPSKVGKEETHYWKWDQHWSNSKYLQQIKADLKEDIAKHGPLQPCADKLIVQGKAMPDGLTDIQKLNKLKSKEQEFGLPYPIPQLVFSQETDGPLNPEALNEEDAGYKPYEEKRGPVLYIEGRTFQVLLKKQAQTNIETHLRENQFLYDVMDRFAATTRCKEVRHICLKNQGTTTIRYQWLRAPPTTATRNLLSNPGKMLNLNAKKETDPNINLIQKCNSGPKEKNNVSVHLTTSRKVDPALVRTLKIMRSCASVDLAYENLMLMISLRVPRLKRVLIRRTGRQLKRRLLPHNVQRLYLKLKQKQKIQRKKKEAEHLPVSPVEEPSEIPEAEEMEEESTGFITQNELAYSDTQDLCPCFQEAPPSDFSSRHELSEPGDYPTDFSQVTPPKHVHQIQPRICECSDPKPTPKLLCRDGRLLTPDYSTNREIPSEDYEYDYPVRKCSGYAESHQSDATSFAEQVFECIGEWGGEGLGEQEVQNELPDGATPDYYPLGYGKSRINRTSKYKTKICHGKLVPGLQLLSAPKGSMDTWLNNQRASIDESSLKPLEPETPMDPNDPIFDELQGYKVTRDYDEHGQRAQIGVWKSHGKLIGESGEGHRLPPASAIPLRPTPKTHQLNTQKLTPTKKSRFASGEHETLGESDMDNYESSTSTSSSSTSVDESQSKPAIVPKEKVLEFLKDPCYDFHFRELPGILLPGQTAKFPIIFRPRKPGFYYETLYLVTHPRLCEATYAVRLNGICMDPEIPTPVRPNTNESTPKNSAKDRNRKKERTNLKTKLERVESGVSEEMLKNQGRHFFEAIIDNVFYLNEVHKSTLPFGRVTTENIFYVHNPNLYYHHGTAEKALKTVRSLVSRIVPKKRLASDHICSLNIESLYQELSKPNIEYNWSNFKTEETENLLTELSQCTKLLIKPNAMTSITLMDKKFNACYFYLLTVISEISFDLIAIEKAYDTPELTEVIKANITDRLQRQEARQNLRREREELQRAALAGANELHKEETLMNLQSNKVDVGTQKDLDDLGEQETELDQPEPADQLSEAEQEATPSEKKKGDKKKGKKIKKKTPRQEKTSQVLESLASARTPTPPPDGVDAEDANQNDMEFSSSFPDQNDGEGNRTSKGSQTEEVPQSQPEISFEFSTMLKEEFDRVQKARKHQAKRVAFENILGVGIERMLCVLDNTNNMNQYKIHEYVTPEPDSHFYCC